MLIRTDGLWYRVLIKLPLWIETARVGNNTTDYAKVWFTKPQR